ncbi:hypothetical protein [Glycomyces rhizosphaerae]|uniref:Uncharacterized protein n=1 Tax=Glycomyces rhizosphaerae TaxID=2054422 RepID=A0ABV7PVH6_9ACTN
MENVKYFFKTDAEWPRENPAGILRRHSAGDEVYNFRLRRWTATDFFEKHRLGHQDFDFVEVPEEEAEQMLAVKQRAQAERERNG